jgi:hypothetical protein
VRGRRTHAGQTETEEVHAEGVDGKRAEVEGVLSVEETEEGEKEGDERVIFERDAASSDILSGLWMGGKKEEGR